MEFTCARCDKKKNIDEFFTKKYITKKNAKHKYRLFKICKECYYEKRKERYRQDSKFREISKERSKIYWRKNREKCLQKYKEWYRKNWDKLRLQRVTKINLERESLIKMLGGKCKVCSIKDFIVLEFDHIKPILNAERNFSNILREVKKYPEKFQLLCANCHRRKTLNELQEYYEKRAEMLSKVRKP